MQMSFSSVKKIGIGVILVVGGLLIYYVTSSLFHPTYLLSTTAVMSTQTECYCPQRLCIDSYKNTTSTHTGDFPDEKVNSGGSVRRFPQAIIIGVRKGGTRALIDMLNIHPDIVAAKGEIHYFDRDENFDKGVQWYIERMPHTMSSQIAIEKSPSYFIAADTPLRMSMVSRNLKLILIVRDPIERAISDFTQLDARRQKKDGTRHTFEELALRSGGEVVNSDYSSITVSMYDVHFKRWLKYFSRNQIHIVNGDKFIKNPVPELHKLETFLSVSTFYQQEMFFFNKEKGFYCWKKTSRKGIEAPFCLGSGKGREHPVISESALEKLKAFFQPHNEAFYSLIGEDFGW